mmetsp:Transcript_75503/g.219327  ORF Transcript_75503/g.219327 Transcript_75503/m.219327 type:complete len:102 (+) Transcript_75503:973-1278(+)
MVKRSGNGKQRMNCPRVTFPLRRGVGRVGAGREERSKSEKQAFKTTPWDEHILRRRSAMRRSFSPSATGSSPVAAKDAVEFVALRPPVGPKARSTAVQNSW